MPHLRADDVPPYRRMFADALRPFRLSLVIGLAVVIPGATGAHAAETASQRGVATACHAEAARFCTIPVNVPGSTGAEPQVDDRDATICLRPYRTSVSLSCRRALTAASR